MTPQLHLRHLGNRYRLPPDIADPAQTAKQLDQIAAKELPEAIDALLPGILASRGFSATSEIAIRRLRLRIRATDAAFDVGTLTAAWAQAFAQALEQGLSTTARGGTATDMVIFVDRISAEREYLVTRARRDEASWWWPVLLEEGGRIPTPSQVLLHWIDREPERVSEVFISALNAAPEGIAALFSAMEAQAIGERLIEQRWRRLAELCGEPPDDHEQIPAPTIGSSLFATAVRKAVAASSAREVQRLIVLLAVTLRVPSYLPRAAKAVDILVDRLVEEPTNERLRRRKSGAEELPEEPLRVKAPTKGGEPRAAEIVRTDIAREVQEQRRGSKSSIARQDSKGPPSTIVPPSPPPPDADSSESMLSAKPPAQPPVEHLISAPEGSFPTVTSETASDARKETEHEVGCGGPAILNANDNCCQEMG